MRSSVQSERLGTARWLFAETWLGLLQIVKPSQNTWRELGLRSSCSSPPCSFPRSCSHYRPSLTLSPPHLLLPSLPSLLPHAMLDTIYITRHGFRMPWRGNELNLSPTGRPRDPVLTAHGVDQVKLLAEHFMRLPEDQRPQGIVSSPYYRCVQTSEPTAKALGMRIHVEPGLAEWFPPTTASSGPHPVPMLAKTASQYSDYIAPSSAWPPLAYPSRQGESIEELHERARGVLKLIEKRCEEKGWKRVLLVSHAATIIALGRGLVDWDEDGAGPSSEPATDYTTGAGREIGAGTAGLSLYARQGSPCLSSWPEIYDAEPSPTAIMAPHPQSAWQQLLNGWCGHLPRGVEREWTFHDIPGNVEEHGMGEGWVDEELSEGGEEVIQRLEAAPRRALREVGEGAKARLRSGSGPADVQPEPPRSKF